MRSHPSPGRSPSLNPVALVLVLALPLPLPLPLHLPLPLPLAPSDPAPTRSLSTLATPQASAGQHSPRRRRPGGIDAAPRRWPRGCSDLGSRISTSWPQEHTQQAREGVAVYVKSLMFCHIWVNGSEQSIRALDIRALGIRALDSRHQASARDARRPGPKTLTRITPSLRLRSQMKRRYTVYTVKGPPYGYSYYLFVNPWLTTNRPNTTILRKPLGAD